MLKMHPNAYSPKRANKWQKMVTNGKKCQKITNNCKISEIIKYGEKMTTIAKNLQKCQKMPKNRPKTGQKMATFQILFLHRFSGSKLLGTSRFHTMFGSRDTHFRSFLAKIRILITKLCRTFL